MKESFSAFRLIVWITQFGLSVISPLLLFIFGAVWLREKFELGGWVIAIGVVFGVLGAVGGLRSSLASMRRLSEKDDKADSPTNFNDHM